MHYALIVIKKEVLEMKNHAHFTSYHVQFNIVKTLVSYLCCNEIVFQTLISENM